MSIPCTYELTTVWNFECVRFVVVDCLVFFFFIFFHFFSFSVFFFFFFWSPWYNSNGWLGVKHQITSFCCYLFWVCVCVCVCVRACVRACVRVRTLVTCLPGDFRTKHSSSNNSRSAIHCPWLRASRYAVTLLTSDPQWGTEKQKGSLCWGPRADNFLPLKPGVGQNIATHASPTARNFSLVLILLSYPVTFIFFEILSLLFNCVSFGYRSFPRDPAE